MPTCWLAWPLLLVIAACGGGAVAAGEARSSTATLDAWGNPVRPAGASAASAPPVAPDAPAAVASGSNVIGLAGVAAFDALPRAARDALGARGVLFMHKSVGEDMVVASQGLGLKWEYASEPAEFATKVLGTALYTTPNGNPLEKIDEFASFVRRAGEGLEAATMKFGYADVESTHDLARLEAKYEAMVRELAAQKPGVRLLHITPALTLGGGGDVGQNKVRAKVGEWMKQRFSGAAVVFDLQDLESTGPDGARCTRDGAPRLCEAHRYKSGGPNGAPDIESQGHLDPAAAKRVAKAFLYAIHRAFQLQR